MTDFDSINYLLCGSPVLIVLLLVVFFKVKHWFFTESLAWQSHQWQNFRAKGGHPQELKNLSLECDQTALQQVTYMKQQEGTWQQGVVTVKDVTTKYEHNWGGAGYFRSNHSLVYCFGQTAGWDDIIFPLLPTLANQIKKGDQLWVTGRILNVYKKENKEITVRILLLPVACEKYLKTVTIDED